MCYLRLLRLNCRNSPSDVYGHIYFGINRPTLLGSWRRLGLGGEKGRDRYRDERADKVFIVFKQGYSNAGKQHAVFRISLLYSYTVIIMHILFSRKKNRLSVHKYIRFDTSYRKRLSY